MDDYMPIDPLDLQTINHNLEQLGQVQQPARVRRVFDVSSCPICYEALEQPRLQPSLQPQQPQLQPQLQPLFANTATPETVNEALEAPPPMLSPTAGQDKEEVGGPAHASEDLMAKLTPIVLPCGHAFCQPCISWWLRSHMSCPNCRRRVVADVVAQGVDLEEVLRIAEHFLPSLEELEKVMSEVAEHRRLLDISGMVHHLGSPWATVQAAAATALGNLPAGSDSLQVSAIAAGAVPLLVRLLASNSAAVQERAVTALWTLVTCNSDSSVQEAAIAAAGAIPSLTALLGHTSAAVQRFAAGTLRGLGEAYAFEVLAAGAIRPLVRLLGSASADVQHEAAWALGNLAVLDPYNQVEVAAAGAIPFLVRLLASGTPSVRAMAARLLGFLAEGNPENRVAAAGAIPLLVQLLGDSEVSSVAAMAAHALNHLTDNNVDNQVEVVAAGAIPLLERLLASTSASVQMHATGVLSKLGAMPNNRTKQGRWFKVAAATTALAIALVFAVRKRA